MIASSKRRVALCGSNLLKQVDEFRHASTKALDLSSRRAKGQFLTPLPVAAFMASLFTKERKELRIIDAGAGAGMLSAALICRYLGKNRCPRTIAITAFEIEPALTAYLKRTYELCAEECRRHGVAFKAEIMERDFIEYATNIVRADMFAPVKEKFNVAIVNPPYGKIATASAVRRLLRSSGIETSNLYAAFMALLAHLLDDDGEMVAITPRSFCNGPYFKTFRKQFFEMISLRRLHVFESRSEAFKDDDVLQENIITHGVKTSLHPRNVVISTSDGSASGTLTERKCAYSEVLSFTDNDRVIHLTTDSVQARFRKKITGLTHRLQDLGLTVSTGRVVDFRAKEYLRAEPAANTVPLIYPCHFNGGYVSWPKTTGRKPNAIVRNEQTEDLLVNAGVYVLVKRFTSKEERRRVVACIYDSSRIPAERVGFENHLDYFHTQGKGLPMDLAKGLAVFLNSTAVDAFFRQFNGHTQVNASDLKRLHFPSKAALAHLGCQIGDIMPDQKSLDDLIRKECFG